MLFNISIFLYIFLLFNREFVPFIDLRLVILPLFLLLILQKIYTLSMKKTIVVFGKRKYITLFILFISIIAISNIKWLFNPYFPNEDVRTNIMILYMYNFTAIMVFSLYWNKLNLEIFSKIILFSGFILFLSMIAQVAGIDDLPFAGQVRGSTDDELSLFGFRVGGYAEDQNYATFSMIIWFLVGSIFIKNKTLVSLLFILSFIGILLSFSKTIILATFIILSFIVAKKLKLLVPYVLFSTVFVGFAAIYLFEVMQSLSTMSIRFKMWEVAFESFINNFLFGSGTSSVRSNFLYQGFWYVQPHNSFVALSHDSGIFAVSIYIFIFLMLFKLENIYYKVMLWMLLFLSLTQELFVFQYPYFVLGILPILMLIKQNNIYLTKIRI